MELKDVNTFLHNHTGSQFFEADLKLFKEKFPESKYIKDFENAPAFKMAEYDERICAELLMHQNSCIDCIWENRGFYVNAEGFIKPLSSKPVNDDLSEIEQELLAFDLSTEKPDYNTMQKFIYEMKLPVANNKGKTYIAALMAKQDELRQKAEFIAEKERLEAEANAGNEDNSGDNTDNSDGADDPVNNEPTGNDPVVTDAAPVNEEKKSEGQELNTQV